MVSELQTNRLRFSFPIISFIDLDYQLFLKSDKPEGVVLGILANFDNVQPQEALEKLLKRVQETTHGELTFNRYINQLRVLSQLRNLQLLLNDAMVSISQYIKEEDDLFFKRGEQRGEQRGELRTKELFVKSLLTKTAMTSVQIADIAQVSVDFVEQVAKIK